MRAVLDPNVLVAALISRAGAPAVVVARGLAGDFEIVVSDGLVAELRRALAAPKLQKRLLPDDVEEFLELIAAHAISFVDPPAPGRLSADPDDDYLIALAERAGAMLVSGDHHLLDLAGQIPVGTARDFLSMLGQ